MANMGDGVLLSVDQFKNYAELEHDADDELVGDLILEAESRMAGYLQVPIVGAEYTEYFDGGTSILFLRYFPLDEDSITITDTQGTVDDATDDVTVDTTVFRVYPEKGEIMRTTSNGQRSSWPHGRRRFKVVYTGGLDQHPLWAQIRYELRGSIRDLVQEWYMNRSPGSAQESEGGGIARLTDKESLALPARVREVWDRYACPMG